MRHFGITSASHGKCAAVEMVAVFINPTDSGNTWNKLTKGLPETMGKTDVSVSAANSKRVYVIVEAEKGGLFRSDDGGKSFQTC